MGEKYNIIDLTNHLEELREEFDKRYYYYIHRMEYLKANKKRLRKKELRFHFRTLTYSINSHTLDIVETLKKCKDYISMNNHGRVSKFDTMVNTDEHKYIRKKFKKKLSKEFRKVDRFLSNAKYTRNEIAHEMTETLKLFLVLQREEILKALTNSLNILNKLQSTNELRNMHKRNQYL